MSEIEPIPEHLQKLIDTVRNNHESMGGEQRGALANLQVLSIMASEKAGRDSKKDARSLKNATWVLAGATLVLGLIAIIK